MKIRTRTVVLAAAVAAVLGLALAAPAEAAPPIVRIAKHKGGPYSNFVNLNTSTNKAKTLWVKTTGDDGTPEDGAMTQFESAVDHNVKYFRGKSNITDEVLAHGGYQFTLSPEKAKRFRVKVKATSSPPEGTCFSVGISNEDGSTQVYGSFNGVLC